MWSVVLCDTVWKVGRFLKSLSDSWQAGAGDQTVAGLCEGKLFSGSAPLSLSVSGLALSQPRPPLHRHLQHRDFISGGDLDLARHPRSR